MLAQDYYHRSNRLSNTSTRVPFGEICSNARSLVAPGVVSPERMSNIWKASDIENRREVKQPIHGTSSHRPSEPRKREGKFAPLLRRKDDRDSRRGAFLSNAKREREDRQFQMRSEQSMRLEWLEEQRQWAAQKSNEEQDVPNQVDEELDIPTFDMVEAERMVSEQPPEIEPPNDDYDVYQYFLLSQSQPPDPPLPLLQHSTSRAQHLPEMMQNGWWSDDDDFEQALLQAAAAAERADDDASITHLDAHEDNDVMMG